ncbi:hypothetical protein MES5069_400111 [Mesorhizobium escarrei]|uniref:HTH tetR-type domain-containing protein n=2 Tax=Mesorhizobium escarrei TaxID=666018 RepID=A0ABM9E5V7_9HYPH|nr:hypothetical protein MES5069_400111 [Mesorhizobium escarrei]
MPGDAHHCALVPCRAPRHRPIRTSTSSGKPLGSMISVATVPHPNNAKPTNTRSFHGAAAGPSKEEWVGAGLAALIEGGIESVRIERLAVSLGVSKGPFYWRFKNRDELLKAIIEFWMRDFTTLLIDQTRDGARTIGCTRRSVFGSANGVRGRCAGRVSFAGLGCTGSNAQGCSGGSRCGSYRSLDQRVCSSGRSTAIGRTVGQSGLRCSSRVLYASPIHSGIGGRRIILNRG